MVVATETQGIPQDIIDQFRQIDVACITDVVHGLKLNCIYHGIKPLVRDWKICGPAVTIRLIPLQDSQNWFNEERHPGSLMQLTKPGDVICIDQGGREDVTIWGGHTATKAKAVELGGVIIDGSCRDSEEIIEAGCPTFTKNTTSLHGHGTLRTTCYNSEPIQLGTISVAPGDLIIGDADAIVVIPASRAAEILPLAQELHRQDLGTYDSIRSGDNTKSPRSSSDEEPHSEARIRRWNLMGMAVPPPGFKTGMESSK